MMMIRMSIITILRSLILGSLLFLSSTTYANFGQTCTSASSQFVSPNAVLDAKNNSILGFVQSIIDVENCGANFSPSCTMTDSGAINVCVKQVDDSTTVPSSINARAFQFEALQLYSLGSITAHPRVISDPNLSGIILQAGLLGNQMCIVMPTSAGLLPVACRAASVSTPIGQIAGDISQCSEVSDGCNLYSQNNHSHATFNFFGNAMQCVYESLDSIFFNPITCSQREAGNIISNFSETTVKPFAEFYNSLCLSVSAALTLYLIVFGVKMALNPEEINVHEIFMAVIKIILVVYFSVGTTAIDWFSGRTNPKNGVTELVLPLLVSFTDTMSTYVFNNSSGNNLCYFSTEDYPRGYGYYALWDSLDCRVNTYLGNTKVFWGDTSGFSRITIPGEALGTLPDLNYNSSPISEGLKPASNTYIQNNPAMNDGLQGVVNATKSIAFFVVTCSMLLAGGFIPFGILVFVMLTVVGLAFSVLMSYMVSIVIIYMLAYIAPIFVPMSLFEKTKGYFEQWQSLLLGTAIQPIIILGFSGFVITLIDSFMFDQCLFYKYNFNDSFGNTKSIFQLMLPNDADASSACQGSIGYKLFMYFQFPGGWNDKVFMFFKVVSLNDVYDLEGSAWLGLCMCFLLKHVLEKTYELSATLSGGISLGGIVSSPMALINLIVASVKTMDDARKKGAQEFMKMKEKGDAVEKGGGGDSAQSLKG